MATGFKSGLPIPLGISAPHQVALGYGPLPFRIGLPGPTAPLVGKGFGPLPFTVGIVQKQYGGRQFFKQQAQLQRDRILREDKEMLEFLSILVNTELLN